jgi:hypothetical protein
VIDDYLRRGQQAARDLWSGPGLTEGMRDPRQLAGRMLQYATDMSAGWVELVSAVMMNGGQLPAPTGQAPVQFDLGGGRPVGRAPAGPRAAAEQPAPGNVQLAVQVQSSRAVKVAVDLQPQAAEAALAVHELRPEASSGSRRPRIGGVVVAREADGRLVVQLKVPSRQPAGVYSGAIIDQGSSLACGRVTVTVT